MSRCPKFMYTNKYPNNSSNNIIHNSLPYSELQTKFTKGFSSSLFPRLTSFL